MRLLQRDLTRFSLIKPVTIKDSDGDVTVTYPSVEDTPPLFAFKANLQPTSERDGAEAYGLDPKNAYVAYTYPECMHSAFAVLDRFTDGVRAFEIKAVRRWDSHVILFAELVNDG